MDSLHRATVSVNILSLGLVPATASRMVCAAYLCRKNIMINDFLFIFRYNTFPSKLYIKLTNNNAPTNSVFFSDAIFFQHFPTKDTSFNAVNSEARTDLNCQSIVSREVCFLFKNLRIFTWQMLQIMKESFRPLRTFDCKT